MAPVRPMGLKAAQDEGHLARFAKKGSHVGLRFANIPDRQNMTK